MRGRDKLLEDVDGTPLVRVMANRARKACAQVRVMLGKTHSARAQALTDLDVAIFHTDPDGGMGDTIRQGILAGAATPHQGPVMILLADMPEITAHDLHLMWAMQAQAPDHIWRAASADGKAGHPVIFPAALIGELAQVTGDKGASDVIARHQAQVMLIPLTGQRAHLDLDTPEDWQAWRAGSGQKA